MIQNRSIVCIPLTTWDNSFTNTMVKMMSILSKKNKVLFVDYQYTYKDVITTVAGKKNAPLKRIFGFNERLRRVKTEYGSDVFVLTTPAVFPVNWIKQQESYNFFLKVNASLIKGSIQEAINDLGMTDPIVINGYNSFTGLPLAGAFNELLNIYYCYDEIKGDIWYKNHGPKVEEDYMRKADFVITTSVALQESKCGVNQNCFVVKNGVDFDLFNKASHYSKLAGKRKIIGYTGSIDERFDLDTMQYAIRNLPDCDFVFVGRTPNKVAKDAVEKFSNVKLLGSKRPDEVPDFLQEMDVCVIPYIKNEVTRGVYPLKINEYLAAGKAVVMTDFAPLAEFKEVASIVSTKEEFVASLKQELQNDNEYKKRIRIETARLNSWENRVEELSGIIERFVENKMRVSA
jgi:glycosyltransferase involved in cell wall biosynthesis